MIVIIRYYGSCELYVFDDECNFILCKLLVMLTNEMMQKNKSSFFYFKKMLVYAQLLSHLAEPLKNFFEIDRSQMNFTFSFC